MRLYRACATIDLLLFPWVSAYGRLSFLSDNDNASAHFFLLNCAFKLMPVPTQTAHSSSSQRFLALGWMANIRFLVEFNVAWMCAHWLKMPKQMTTTNRWRKYKSSTLIFRRKTKELTAFSRVIAISRACSMLDLEKDGSEFDHNGCTPKHNARGVLA